MSPFAVVGFSALALVVVTWLVISFTEPGPHRRVVERRPEGSATH